MITLPPWDPSLSDGCSWAPLLTAQPKARACCLVHDERYYYGGSRTDRYVADVRFRECLRAAGVSWWEAWTAFYLIRWNGGPNNRSTYVSWAFGGEVFAYTERPAQPVETASFRGELP